VNRCLFCSNTAKMGEFGEEPVRSREITDVLKRKRREGFEHVTFTGGEPTLYPRFWEVLREAKELGYRTQTISNGAALAVPGFAEKVFPHLDELCLSVHGASSAVHDKVTQNPKGFGRLVKAMDAVDAWPRPIFLVVNTVVTRLNVGSLERIARFVCARRQVRQFWVSSLIPEGEALVRYEDLAVSYSKIMRKADAVAAIAAKRRVALRFFGFPPCVLGKHREADSRLYKNPNAAVFRAASRKGKTVLRELDGGMEDPESVKTDRCRGCSETRRCRGVWKEYEGTFGDRELKAFRKRAGRRAAAR
jgi:MoaA/NifB/PqqE/SkfB family radical SAM enzyme